jgi:predicted nucleic acid-binding protein
MARARAPYGGGVFIADTSAWARAHEQRVRRNWLAALRNRQIATCPIVNLELLYSTRNASEFDELAADLAHLHDVPITRSVTDSALGAFRELAAARPLFQRSVKLPDLLIAAAAADVSVGVLHYDAHFDRLARVLPFESRWIAPSGSLP